MYQVRTNNNPAAMPTGTAKMSRLPIACHSQGHPNKHIATEQLLDNQGYSQWQQ